MTYASEPKSPSKYPMWKFQWLFCKQASDAATDLFNHLDEKLRQPKKYYKTMDWFARHRFYLPQNICDELNKIKSVMQNELLKLEGAARTPHDFIVSKEMDDSYFFD